MDGRAKYADFERCIRRRNRVELGAAVVAVPVIGLFLVLSPLDGLARAAMSTSMAGAGVVAWVLHRFGSVRPLPEVTEPREAIERLRSELRRHARLLQWAPAWYVLPLLAPAPVFFYAVARERGEPLPLGMIGAVLVAAGVLAGLNLAAAGKMRREADALA